MQPGAGESSGPAVSSPFPSDLLGQSARRLRVLALLYAFVFFMADIFPMLLRRADRVMLVSSFVVFVLRQICHSLSEAESRGLVHRVIKPRTSSSAATARSATSSRCWTSGW